MVALRPDELEVLIRHYHALDLEPNATVDEIKEAYRLCAQVWHPDRFVGNEKLRAKAEERMKLVNTAYEQIADAPLLALSKMPPKPASVPHTPGGYGQQYASHAKMPFGKYKGKPLEDVPSHYLIWCLENLDRLGEPLASQMDEVLTRRGV